MIHYFTQKQVLTLHKKYKNGFAVLGFTYNEKHKEYRRDSTYAGISMAAALQETLKHLSKGHKVVIMARESESLCMRAEIRGTGRLPYDYAKQFQMHSKEFGLTAEEKKK